VVIYPVKVQGVGAADEVAEGIRHFNAFFPEVDVLIVGRGGGSIEDLWAFNEEVVAKSIFDSKIPIISAVGHEVDFTIADFVADLRAPTPSAAGEILTAGWLEIVAQLQTLQERIVLGMRRKIIDAENRLQHLSSRLRSPRDLIREKMQRADEISMRLQAAIRVKLEKSRYQYELWAGKLNMLSPLRVLERGFTLTFRNDGKEVIRSANQLETQDEIRIRFKDGEKKALVL
jgi:exodeoxyribonuclease VII large subunit